METRIEEIGFKCPECGSGEVNVITVCDDPPMYFIECMKCKKAELIEAKAR